mgnify:CR=1 FL=1
MRNIEHVVVLRSLHVHAVFCAGWILIDRCGKHFGLILNFLRDSAVVLPESRREDLLEILTEAKYYCIQQLVEQCEQVCFLLVSKNGYTQTSY